jgi:hypothetical protein
MYIAARLLEGGFEIDQESLAFALDRVCVNLSAGMLEREHTDPERRHRVFVSLPTFGLLEQFNDGVMVGDNKSQRNPLDQIFGGCNRLSGYYDLGKGGIGHKAPSPKKRKLDPIALQICKATCSGKKTLRGKFLRFILRSVVRRRQNER